MPFREIPDGRVASSSVLVAVAWTEVVVVSSVVGDVVGVDPCAVGVAVGCGEPIEVGGSVVV
jgi:hypothetical protein